MRTLLGLIALLGVASVSLADAEQVVKDQLAKLKAEGASVQPLKDPALGKTFPDYEFVSVRFPQFPVARLAPEPLRSSNIYVVSKEKTTLLSDDEALYKWFKSMKFGDREADRKNAVRAWLRLTQELKQDGFYKFKVEEDSLKTADGKVSGKAVVTEGGNGEITVTLDFDGQTVKGIESGANLKAGPRPRCHATLLLDANPLVRTIAEEDLLIMGRSALPYLAEQHAKASPELRKAIERVRRRILAGER
jgi:hypothetical protein